MSRSIFPIWVLVLVACAIALAAFAAGQMVEGLGMIVAIAGSSLWLAFVVLRTRKAKGAVHD